ncbi:Uridylate kinase [Thalictrum thalictroides]|uniref:UMP kinase n=1 Tax=Thalictrum thalictroides TaxID=46969 RepID=A0A7J6XB13_THATH|nr:Uridylate kinase [Thalictrum thalictroides]
MKSLKFLILLFLTAFLISTQADPSNNNKLFREYIGAEGNNVSFTDIQINSNVEFHFILSFAIDYTTSSSSPSPTNVDSWVKNAVNSLTKIIKEYNLDGIDIDYEHFIGDPNTFTECIGQLISTLKEKKVIKFASIAPYDDGPVQSHYQALWNKYDYLIDYVNFQFYAYDKGTTVSEFLKYYEIQSSNYKGGKILVSFSTDASGGLKPVNGFFRACRKLKSQGKLHGIFVWSADDSKASGFPYERTSQALLATPLPPPSLPAPPSPLSPTKRIGGGGGPTVVDDDDDDEDEEEENEDDYSEAGFCSQANTTSKCPSSFPFSSDQGGGGGGDHFVDESSDLNKCRANSRPEKQRRDRDELSDGGTPYYKRSKSGEYRVDSRKDREEWSDTAISCLLDAYTDKFNQLNRGNLRGRDWEEVSAIVSDRCDKLKAGKSVEQCKNKVDNLKKRYKVELQRMNNSGTKVTHWIWFKKIEQIVNNASTSKAVSDEDKSVGGGSANMLRQAKRYPTGTNVGAGLVNNIKPKSLSNPRWRRVVFKISGAALAGTGSQNIDAKVALLIAREVAIACRLGVEVAIVLGGRNFFCGDSWVTSTGLDRSTAYQIGMMATVMNSILLQSALEKLGVETRVQTAFAMQEVAEPYNKRRAIRHLEKGRVVIFGGIGASTGNSLFTTDTAAALRASEVNADAVLKGTNVEGVYDCHSRNSNNVTFEHISFRELVSRGVTSMDMMAITFCEENGIPVVVFNLHEPGNISRALCGEQVGTLIDQAGRIS